ncbi:hypothetical protein ACIRN4_24295 [Pimelobacter simplex]|uniref:hypothetical protein n=1 Tax=Nocardioides simplex TaxID=2045 RepID=UPI003817DB6E
MAGGDALNKPDQREFTAQMELLVRDCIVIAAGSPDARDLAPTLRDLVALVQANPEHAEVASSVFLDLLEERPGELILGVPGTIEILEFSMHRLRWPAMQSALSKLVQSANDPRVSRAAGRVLEAFDSDWAGGEIYDESPRGADDA